jgi:hypothetical protein
MQLIINVPLRADIINGGFEVVVAGEGKSWSKSQLGAYADKSSIYLHHANGKILYVGKTTSGQWGTYGERLRREFQLLTRALTSKPRGVFWYTSMYEPLTSQLERSLTAASLAPQAAGLVATPDCRSLRRQRGGRESMDDSRP